jgi:4-aminobutyrate aminotransferase-like enzyme
MNGVFKLNYAHTLQRKPLKFKYTKGQYLYEQDGSKLLYFMNNVSHFGHCHLCYVSNMQKKLAKFLT